MSICLLSDPKFPLTPYSYILQLSHLSDYSSIGSHQLFTHIKKKNNPFPLVFREFEET